MKIYTLANMKFRYFCFLFNKFFSEFKQTAFRLFSVSDIVVVPWPPAAFLPSFSPSYTTVSLQ